ncbi:MAG: TetR/AcrR family transcriptional regulator [Anaerolineae bacterium]|nr:TetR/AcrR family transcriptional regulator [Anaerolineae bacterium]
MPYPAQTDYPTIVAMAHQLIEQEGAEQLSLAQLAAACGIKAPSLYRHIPNKAALLRAVNSLTINELFTALAAAQQTTSPDPQAQLTAILYGYRAFALAHPQTYNLAFTTLDPAERPETQTLEPMVLPIQDIMAQISGAEHSLAALRGALALVHGFVSLEMKGQFQRGGDLDGAFAAAVHAYLQGWQVMNT